MMRRLTNHQKKIIAYDYVSGKSVAEVCRLHNISESAFYRLRREDECYQAAEQEYAEEARASISRTLEAVVERAINTLSETLGMDAHNFVETEGRNGGRVVTRRIDVKLLQEKRLAADCLLSHWQRLSEHRQTQRNWERLNLSLIPDDDDDDFDDDDEDDTSALLRRAQSLGSH
jgi:transposase-like protein